MIFHNYFMNKETGEIVTYSEANKIFYSKPRTWRESVFDEWIETKYESPEPVAFPDFANVLRK